MNPRNRRPQQGKERSPAGDGERTNRSPCPALGSGKAAARPGDVRQREDELKVTREEPHSSIAQRENFNEELNTLNNRLQEKVEELDGANNDLANLLAGTSIATVFLDREFRVRRYTPACTRLFRLIPSDVGRPLADLRRRFVDEELLDDAGRVLADLTPAAGEVRAEDGRWYLRNLTPYRTHEDRIEGVVVTFVDITERKRAEEALQRLNAELEERVAEQTAEIRRSYEVAKAERQRLYDLLETLPVYVVLLTPDYHVPFANRFFRERFGESHGRRCFEYLFNRSEACEICETYTVMKTRGPHHWEWTGPDGRDYDIFDFPFPDTDGSPLILEMGIDITEVKRAEAALKQMNETLEQRVAERTAALAASEERYRLLFENMAEGFALHEIILDEAGRPRDYRFLEVNPAFERLTGLKRADLLGRTLLEVLPDSEPFWVQTYGQVALTGEPVHVENLSAPLGLHYEVFAFRPAEGKFACVFVDITARKRAEEEREQVLEAVRRNEQRLGWALQAGRGGAWDWDLTTGAAWWSPEMYDLWGLEPGTVMRTENSLAIVDEDDRERVRATLADCLDKHIEPQYEFRVCHPRRGRRWMSTLARAFYDEDGGAVRMLGITLDVTERKQAEEALTEHAQGLEFLSASAMRFLEQMPSHELFRFVGEQLRGILRTGVVVVSEYNPGTNQITVRSFEGPDDKIRQATTLLGGSPLGMEFPFAAGTLEKMQRGGLTLVEGGLHDLSFAQLPLPLCREIETGLDLGAVHAMPLLIGDDLLGTVAVVTDRAEGLKHRSVIESFVNQAALSLKHRRAEDAVLRAKEEWEQTFNTVPDLVAILDDRHRIIRVNKAMAERLGVSPEQCLGLICHEAVHGLPEPPAFCPHTQTCRDGREHTAEVKEPRLRGHFLVSTTPRVDGAGKLVGAVHVARDITVLKQAEQALRESELRLNRAQEIAHLGSWELDRVSNRLSWSDEVYRVFGLEPQQFGATYEAFLEAVHPDDRAAVDAAYSGSLREGKPSYEIEHRVVRRATGEIRVVLEKCQHMTDGSGRVMRSIGMVLDVTERKQVEEDLRRTLQELARSNRELEQFAYVTSHDLKEPLRMVTGFTGLLKDRYQGKLDAKADQYISFAADAAARMHELIDDMLSYARVGRDSLTESTDVAVAVARALGNLQGSIEQAGARITCDALPTVRANAVELVQLFQNLVGNAIKFRSERPPEVHLSARRRDGEWVFTVRDNGIGIDPKYRDRIFVIFERLHTRDRYPGTGIGLAICKKIVERHGGRIRVDSEKDKGATFAFTLPA